MPTFAGTVTEFLAPTPILAAEVEHERLNIQYGSWVFKAESRDGFYYEGTYGERQPDPNRLARFWCYSGPDGSKIVYCEWENCNEAATQGESVFRLFPHPALPGGIGEMPAEWDRATKALSQSQARIGTTKKLKLLLAHDRQAGQRDHAAAWHQPGLYVLFYGNGRIARVGQAHRRSLARRLADYEPHASGWFSYRWVGLIPFESDQREYITLIEDDLLAALKPPENVKGVK